jgi:hypothetical protein
MVARSCQIRAAVLMSMMLSISCSSTYGHVQLMPRYVFSRANQARSAERTVDRPPVVNLLPEFSSRRARSFQSGIHRHPTTERGLPHPSIL